MNTQPRLRIRWVEGVLGFRRQAYYQYWQRHRKQVNEEAQILQLVNALRQQHPRMGTRKLYVLLQPTLLQQGIHLGRDALFDLLAAHGLLVRRRRRCMRTTFSCHRFRKYPNLLTDLVVERANQLWVADITYWFTQAGCFYLSLITDAYSKRIMGYTVAETLQTVHCVSALQMALQQLPTSTGKTLMHHSDRGIQYCSAAYIALLNSYQVQISMTEKGDPRENAIAERVNGILKQEYLAHQTVASFAQAQAVVQQAVFLYNYKRPHLSCDMLVPDVAHQGFGKLRRRWQNYYRKRVLNSYLVIKK